MSNKAFESKSYIEIFNMLLENYRAIYGGEIDLSVETAFGEELRMNTEFYMEFSQLAQDIYYTLDVNNAKGAILDNLVSFTSNMVRKTNIQTILRADISFDRDIENYNETSRIYVEDDNGVSWKVVFDDAPYGTIPAYDDEGEFISHSALLTCVGFGENYLTRIVLMSVNNQFHTGIVTTGNIVYEQIGSIEESDEMLRMRKNNILSYNSVGVLDSIRDYILKNIFSVKDVKIYNANGRSTVKNTLDVRGNSKIDVLIEENGIEGSKSVGIARHDVFVIIQPQEKLDLSSFVTDTVVGDITTRIPTRTSLAIGDTIKKKMTPGVATSAGLFKFKQDGDGNEVVDEDERYDIEMKEPGSYDFVTSENVGKDDNYIKVNIPVEGMQGSAYEEYRFYIARQYSPKIVISLQTRNNYDQVSSRARIREAIYQLSRNYTIDRDIDIAEVLTAVMSSNLDSSNPTFIPINIEVGGDVGDTGVKVNNGYWLVDKDAPGYGITIIEG